jgi:hypothetical protein
VTGLRWVTAGPDLLADAVGTKVSDHEQGGAKECLRRRPAEHREMTVLCWLSPQPYACGRDTAWEGCVLDSPATMTRTSALRERR